MSTISRRRIRLKLDVAKATSYKHLDVNTSQNPEHWRGNDLQFELGICFNDTLSDISNLASITLEVKDASAEAGTAALMSKTILAADLDPTLNAASWADQTKQHALVIFTGAEANIAAASNYWLVVSAITTDVPGRTITLGVATFAVVEDRTGATTVPQVNQGVAYTQAEADARYIQKHADMSFFQERNHTLYWYEQTTAHWYPVVIAIVDNVPTLTLGPGESL
jgi:hypothetical protein